MIITIVIIINLLVYVELSYITIFIITFLFGFISDRLDEMLAL